MTQKAANTLFVTTDGAYLAKDQETVVVSVERTRRAQIPFLAIQSVACFGRVTISPELMGALAARGISMAFYSYSGKFLARVEGVPNGNVLLRRAQHRAADDPGLSATLAQSFIVGKLVNGRRFLQHAARNAHTPEVVDGLHEAASQLKVFLKELDRPRALETIRGIEGIAAVAYFGAFDCLIKREFEAFRFSGRTRRPPKDRINALLSFGYTLLHGDCAGAATGVGLDPAIGFLHEDRPGRMGLALDLMEELRSPIVDRLVVSMINKGQIGPHDLQEDAAGGWRMTDNGRKTFLAAYQKAKQDAVHHAYLDEETTWALIPHLQARLLARCLRNDLEAYPPFTIRS